MGVDGAEHGLPAGGLVWDYWPCSEGLEQHWSAPPGAPMGAGGPRRGSGGGRGGGDSDEDEAGATAARVEWREWKGRLGTSTLGGTGMLSARGGGMLTDR